MPLPESILFPTGSSADFSPYGRYRYALGRRWADGATIARLMLTPSTVDASQDDPAIRRRISFSRAWGCGGLTLLNLFAYRANDPRNLPTTAADAVGPDNDRWIVEATRGRRVVCAWSPRSLPPLRASDRDRRRRAPDLPPPEAERMSLSYPTTSGPA